MLYLICTMIFSVDLVDLTHYGVSCAKDWVSVDCGTMDFNSFFDTRESRMVGNHLTRMQLRYIS